jgi:hypothetical protein
MEVAGQHTTSRPGTDEVDPSQGVIELTPAYGFYSSGFEHHKDLQHETTRQLTKFNKHLRLCQHATKLDKKDLPTTVPPDESWSRRNARLVAHHDRSLGPTYPHGPKTQWCT